MDLSTREKLHEFALSVEKAAQEAAAEAISQHRSLGNPIYFCDQENPDILIKELADGRRFHVMIDGDGSETTVERLP